jgi:hypothetical protein
VPEAELKIAEERVRRFARFGGVDLSNLGRPDPLLAEVEVGVANYKKAVFGFRCPICGTKRYNDQEMEMVCTGPSWTDDHPMEPMTPLGIVDR